MAVMVVVTAAAVESAQQGAKNQMRQTTSAADTNFETEEVDDQIRTLC